MVEKRFRALRTLATLIKALALLILIGGVIAGSLMIGLGTVGGTGLGGNVLDLGPGAPSGLSATAGGVVMLLASIVYFVMFYGAGEAIFLLIALEENSRETTVLLRELWTAFGPRRGAGIERLDDDDRSESPM